MDFIRSCETMAELVGDAIADLVGTEEGGRFTRMQSSAT